MIRNDFFFEVFTPAKIVIYQNIQSNDLAGKKPKRIKKIHALWHIETFEPFKQVWSFGLKKMCSTVALYDVFFFFF